MAVVALRQTGILKHLPELPFDAFDSEQVVLSRTAFALGVPDATIAVTSLALNIPLAATGGRDRASVEPWVPCAAAAKVGVDSIVSAWYLSRESAWRSYCLIAAGANFVTLALSLPECRRAIRTLRGRSVVKLN